MSLKLYNTLTRAKEDFVPLTPPFVGMYVCGPTVYSDVHLGNCRTFISFDILYRYLLHLGYKVRYVRNITDAGHLESDADIGEDKIAKKARLEQLEPMEVVQRYTVGFRKVMDQFNLLPPSIEPVATGHIIEQIEMTKKIISQGFAYEVNGSVYFDVEKYAQVADYGMLTNRKLEDLMANTRDLDGQDEKKGRLDFALWIKAKPEHIMKWPSPWGEGFPGWHIECSAMSKKYLGESFDIHGGGMDLAATHHTNEIAQSVACHHTKPVNYWIHTNMLTVNGQRMGKSLGNAFLPEELFSGSHPLLEKGYAPMAVRFFMLQTHYRSTLDFSNEALQASEKGFWRMMEAWKHIGNLPEHQEAGSLDADMLEQEVYAALNDDLNTPVALAHLFDGVKFINAALAGTERVTAVQKEKLLKLYNCILGDVFGLKPAETSQTETVDKLMQTIIEMRNEAKSQKNFLLSDLIRDKLSAAGIQMMDGKEGTTWKIRT
ncbi:MAG: cysteine--tRNA ligase [Bacteroidota bacterium]|jgi:cysteinyl-tRNA synthetase